MLRVMMYLFEILVRDQIRILQLHNPYHHPRIRTISFWSIHKSYPANYFSRNYQSIILDYNIGSNVHRILTCLLYTSDAADE